MICPRATPPVCFDSTSTAAVYESDANDVAAIRSVVRADVARIRATGVVRSPATGKIIPVYRSNNNYKAFKPHTDVNQDRHKESNGNASPHFTEPENLR